MDTFVPTVSVYMVHLLNFLYNQGHFAFQFSKLRLVTSATKLVATWLLDIKLTWSYLASDQVDPRGHWASWFNFVRICIKLTCSYLASDQADHRGPWASCFNFVPIYTYLVMFLFVNIWDRVGLEIWKRYSYKLISPCFKRLLTFQLNGSYKSTVLIFF